MKRRLLLVSLLLVLTALLLPAPAGAAVGDGWSASWTRSPDSWGPMSPGSTRTAELEVVNERDAEVGVRLGVVDVVDDEGGCLEQEVRSELDGCGAPGDTGSGELGEQLLASVSADGASLHDGALLDLVADRTDSVVVPAGGTRVLSLVVTLPESSTNETMTDRVTFGLEASAQDLTSGAEVGSAVLGTSLDADGPTVGTTSGAGPQAGPTALGGLLPATGTAISIGLVAAALVLVGVGAALWRLGRRGRHVT